VINEETRSTGLDYSSMLNNVATDLLAPGYREGQGAPGRHGHDAKTVA